MKCIDCFDSIMCVRKHWILSVVSPSEELVYFMDPMKRRMDVTTDEWRTIVNQYVSQFASLSLMYTIYKMHCLTI